MDPVAQLGAEHVVDEPVLGDSRQASKASADTTALKWWPSPVTSALAPGMPASIRSFSSWGVADMLLGYRGAIAILNEA